MRLSGREQVSHKTLSALFAELELYGYVEVERKGRGRGPVYIYPTDSGRAARRRHRQIAFCAGLLLKLLTTIYTPCEQFFLSVVK
jgi:DNA-binding MarR family transcriptional regulator